ncbi:polysaccharide pyruvyl transferase family protein [Derxia gummosa]|uniref:Polysaccharide pyruvyl transferase family protein n=1 Tax=Derxia gummosa DSM 723 TaxID=1121388 RepID=A0A8B6X5N3_9BURK|nr:polysaccharide pyruvyl transferase family protein [Derxia gummosa]
MWFDDAYWRAAATAALAAAEDFDWVLTPAEFHGLHPRFRPVEYSEIALPGRVAFLCHKDGAARLAPAWRLTEPEHYRFANEVFVLGSIEPAATPPDAAIQRHLGSWFERCRALAAPVERLRGEARRALIVGASGMGNVGDDLIAAELRARLLDDGLFDVVDTSSFEVAPARLAQVDAVLVGGGGLLYVSQAGEADYQNLANYLRFVFWCERAGAACHLVALGDQDYARLLEQDDLSRRFATEALRRATSVTVRDQESAQLVRRLSLRTAAVGADPVWALAHNPAAEAPLAPDATLAPLFIGEFGRFPAFAAWLATEEAVAWLKECEGAVAPPAVAVMSRDDERHVRALVAWFAARGITLPVIDLRGRAPAEIVAVFRQHEPVLTTRFHGAVLALAAGRAPIVFDRRHGKKERLLRSTFPALAGQLIEPRDRNDHLAALVARARAGTLARPERADVLAHARTTHSHARPLRDAVRKQAPGRKSGQVHPEALLDDSGAIRLCWARSWEESGGYANFGDALSAFIVANLAGKPVRHTDFGADLPKLVGIGSIGHAIRNGQAVIWGTGCYRPDLMTHNVPHTRYDVRATRGPISQRCLGLVGVDAPGVFGEPGWLLPSMFDEPVEKKYELGVITHIGDLREPHPNAQPKEEWVCFDLPDALRGQVAIISTWHEAGLEGLLDKLRLILSCKRIASRSFHGIVIAEAFGIPCIPLCAKPGVPVGAFPADAVPTTLLDRRTLEFFQSGSTRKHNFYGQRRTSATDWEALIAAIDRVWSPLDYDVQPLVEAFPFEPVVDPLSSRVPLQRDLATLGF